jgi:hypothetical protein
VRLWHKKKQQNGKEKISIQKEKKLKTYPTLQNEQNLISHNCVRAVE